MGDEELLDLEWQRPVEFLPRRQRERALAQAEEGRDFPAGEEAKEEVKEDLRVEPLQ